MGKVFEWVSNWSEVWALLIPLLFLRNTSKLPPILKPVVIYLWFALAFNFFADFIGDFKKIYPFPYWLQSNNPIYNIHSVVRFACFSYFFISLPQHRFKTLKKIIVLIFVVYFIIDFTFFESFFYHDHLSGNLLSAEAYLLLTYCMLYYLAVLLDEDDAAFKGPVFWVVTGLSLYVVTNFFVFLFYVPMITQNAILTDHMWDVHNAVYIILCLFITRAFYIVTRKYAAIAN
jgi:hypothetical protein